MSEEQIQQPIENGIKPVMVETDNLVDGRKINALTHGGTANLLTPLDSDIDLQETINQISEELTPWDFISKVLVENVALNFIKMVRSKKIEKSIINNIINPPRLIKKYKDKEEGRRYIEAEMLYEEKRREHDKQGKEELISMLDRNMPAKNLPPKPQMEVYYEYGEQTAFTKEKLEDLVNLCNRYETSQNSKFYKALRELLNYFETRKK